MRPLKAGMSAIPRIYAGSASMELGRKIAEAYGIQLGTVKLNRFSDGEMQPSFEDSVRGDDVFIVQSTFPPAENILELLLMVDAAKRASARQIVAVIPYFGYARQDRKDKPRVSIGAKLIANLLTAAGVTRIMTMDLHADQIQGFFDVPVDHLFASTIFVPYIQNLGLDNIVIAAPDIGGSKRANSYAKYLNCEMALCYKQRKVANEVESMTVIGDVAHRNVIMLDDMIDTGGTLTRAAEMMMDRGALSVRALCTHPVLSGDAIERIEKSCLTEVVVTDTIPVRRPSEKFVVLSCAELFSNTIYKLLHDESISSQFIF